MVPVILSNGPRWLRALIRRHPLWRNLRFSQPEMEAQFQAADDRFTISLAYYWIVLSGLFLTLGLFVRCNKYGWYRHPDLAFALYFIPFGILAVMLAFIHIPFFKAHTYNLVCGANLVLITWIACSVHVNVGEEMRIIESTVLAEVFAALQQNEGAYNTLHRYVSAELGRKYLWYSLVINFCHLDVLQFLNFTWASITLFISVPVSVWVVSFLSPLLGGVTVEVLIMALILLLYTMGLSYYMVLSRRRQFQLNYRLQRTLEKEAAALKEAAEQEAALKKASQEADSILNHLLKNVMADAAGCIHLYLQSLPSSLSASSAPPADLVQATECLERGVAWCRKRQALFRIATGKYTPQLCDVDLSQFGHSLLQGRPIEAEFPTDVVIMDPLLCEIVLENALTNAHRHGHPTDPAVRFTAALAPLPPGNAPQRRLTFSVTNRAHPSRPPLTPDPVASLLRGEERPVGPPASRLSEHLGMQHLTQAAHTHNMDLRLFQEEDAVYFEASLEVALPPVVSPPQAPSKEHITVVPPNLCILCIDDSPVARRLLVHTLSRPPMSATVTAFGETAEEVTGFLEQALGEADIVILDYHLDYGSIHFLGTDLLRTLVARGYRGLICMRSANASPYDEALYIRAGAHCCIGKDIHPKAMAAALVAAYLRRDVHRMPEPSLVHEVDCDATTSSAPVEYV